MSSSQKKLFAFEVYTVDLRSDSPLTLASVVKAAHASGKQRTIADDPYSITECGDRGGTLFADVERNRLSDPLPTRAKVGQKSKPLDWADDEGPGHSTAFAIRRIAGQEVLLLQRNRQALGARQLERLLMDYDESIDSLSFHRVLTPEAYKRIGSMGRITSLSIKVATPHERLLMKAGDSSSAALDLAADMNQASIELKLTAARHSSLKKSTCQRIINWWKGLNDESEESVSMFKIGGVTGEEDDAKSEFVNLLKEAMTGWAEVDLRHRQATFAGRRSALSSVFDALEAQIAESIKKRAK